MKKIMMILAITISTLNAFASNNFGKPVATTEKENVNQKVLNAFQAEFSTAKNVNWTLIENYYRATFTYNEKYLFAYFNENGELLGLAHYLSPANLPLNLQTNLKKNYENYWISDLIEVSKSEGTTYYITLENADTKLVLNSSGGSNWSVHNKIRKS